MDTDNRRTGRSSTVPTRSGQVRDDDGELERDGDATPESGGAATSEQGSQGAVKAPAGRGRPVASRARPSTARSRANVLRRNLILADAAAFTVGVLVAVAIQLTFRPVPRDIVERHIGIVVLTLPAFALGAGFNHLYQGRANERPLEEARNVAKAVGMGMGFLLLLALAVQYNELSRLFVASMAVCVTLSVLVERRIARSMFRRMRQGGQLMRRIVIVGTDAHAIGLMHAYDRNPALGYKVVGFAGDDDIGPRSGVSVLGPISELRTLLEDHEAVGVVVSLASVPSDDVNLLTRRLTDDGYHVALSSSLRDIDVTRLRPQSLDGRTMIYVEPTIRHGWRAIAKRVFDVSLAAGILVVTLPVQLVAAAAIKLTSPGAVFFRQVRVGKDGELFQIVKFRTMVVDAEERKAELAAENEADGPLFKMERDPRVTSVGRLLRKLSIDELPQLLNVIVGSMSMVGPRPALPDEVEQWDEEVRDRLRVLPGLTGMWQVSGRSDSTFEQYKRMDLYYVDNWSLFHDIKICVRTVGVVLSGSGAS
ncbi:sugar transferase [Ilumatobacter sp.]|uniref:sugar transferase n=1 Tax=Ilumatobacter sp. TaxID=1967498 RepID=UPI003B52ACF0